MISNKKISISIIDFGDNNKELSIGIKIKTN